MQSPNQKIDIHTHILPKNWEDLKAKYGYDGWVNMEHRAPGCARMMIDGKGANVEGLASIWLRLSMILRFRPFAPLRDERKTW